MFANLERRTRFVDSNQPDAPARSAQRIPPAARIGIVLSALLVIGGFLWFLQSGLSPKSDTPRIGSLAPNFTATDLNGQAVSLNGARGHPVILNFWATWCVPCKVEMPAITAVAKTDPNVVVLAVNVLDGPVLVQRFAKDISLGFVPLLDPTGRVAGQYKVDSLPSSFFIAPDGTIRAINIGPMDQTTIEQNLKRASL
jgi:thiol-disulfide isomerase/thioredoxin